MARVNMDEGAWEMAEAVACEMEWEEDAALGRLATFYKKSQALGVWDASEKEIAFWFRVKAEHRSKLIKALLEARVIKPAPQEGLFTIRGNKRHIENVQTKKAVAQANGAKGGRPAKKGGDETNAETSEETDVGSEEKPTSVPGENQPGNPNTVQGSSPQGSSSNPIQHTAPLDAAYADCVLAWLGTLGWHGVPRDHLGQSEDALIKQAIRRVGNVREVCLAIIGARFEEGSADYEPSNHCKLARYLDAKKLQGFADLGRLAQDPTWVLTWVKRKEERKSGLRRGKHHQEDEVTAEDLKAAVGGVGGP